MSVLPSRSPSTYAVPVDGCSMAAAMRSSDVLPAPLGPMTTQRSSSSTAQVTGPTRVFPPRRSVILAKSISRSGSTASSRSSGSLGRLALAHRSQAGFGERPPARGEPPLRCHPQDQLHQRADAEGVDEVPIPTVPPSSHPTTQHGRLDGRAHQPDRQARAGHQAGHQTVARSWSEARADVEHRADGVEQHRAEHHRDADGQASRLGQDGQRGVDGDRDDDRRWPRCRCPAGCAAGSTRAARRRRPRPSRCRSSCRCGRPGPGGRRPTGRGRVRRAP